MDVYLPGNRTDKTAVVLLIHGGAFVAGDKNDMSLQSQALSSKGFVVLNVNYRLVDTVGLLQLPPVHRASTIRINEQMEDIKSAIEFASGKAAEWIMSSEKWAVCGHSAGGTLALLAGYNYSATNSSGRLHAVANWAGVTDFSFTNESQFNLLDPRIKELYYRVSGFEPVNANKLAYMAFSPTWIAYSGSAIPTLNIRPEFNSVFGEPDVSQLSYQAFTNTLNAKAVPNKWVEVAGANHVFSQPGNWDRVIKETSTWFELQLK